MYEIVKAVYKSLCKHYVQWIQVELFIDLLYIDTVFFTPRNIVISLAEKRRINQQFYLPRYLL